jgi:hypothetical protein
MSKKNTPDAQLGTQIRQSYKKYIYENTAFHNYAIPEIYISIIASSTYPNSQQVIQEIRQV